jgi:ribosomal protein S18 acetylase RimI-like enzyme
VLGVSIVRLQSFKGAQLLELMSWFPDKKSCQTWGGPDFRFPYTETTFQADAKLEILPTRALVQDDGAFIGFGQYYLRAGRCHLGRLAIAPRLRGRGLGSTLVHKLCEEGSGELGVESYSLFVLPDNENALRLYRRLGFAVVPYPESLHGVENHIYMVALRLAVGAQRATAQLRAPPVG